MSGMRFSAVVVSAHLPSQPGRNIGVLVLGPDRLDFRFCRDLDNIAADPMDQEVFASLPQAIAEMAMEMGPVGLIEWLEDSASHSIRITDRIELDAPDAEQALNRAFLKYIT